MKGKKFDIQWFKVYISSVQSVGPDITARDRLVKDLPNGIFAGKKLTPKVCKYLEYNKWGLEVNGLFVFEAE